LARILENESFLVLVLVLSQKREATTPEVTAAIIPHSFFQWLFVTTQKKISSSGSLSNRGMKSISVLLGMESSKVKRELKLCNLGQIDTFYGMCTVDWEKVTIGKWIDQPDSTCHLGWAACPKSHPNNKSIPTEEHSYQSVSTSKPVESSKTKITNQPRWNGEDRRHRSNITKSIAALLCFALLSHRKIIVSESGPFPH
jgi:hypothetical protein